VLIGICADFIAEKLKVLRMFVTNYAKNVIKCSTIKNSYRARTL
jgi:hypothetical protein